MATSNTTTSASDTTRSIAYACVGALSFSVNMLTLAIFLKEKKLLNRSAVVVGIVIANFTVSLHICGVGSFRLIMAEYLDQTTDPYVCLLTVLPLLYPVSFASEGLFIFIGGLERMMAINVPIWFHKDWSNKSAWKIIAACYIAVTIFATVGIFDGLQRPVATWSCGAGVVFSTNYRLACQLISAVGGAAGAALALLALVTGVYRIRNLPYLSGNAGRLRKQLQLTKPMSLVSLADFCLVGVPNILSVLQSAMPRLVFPSFVKASNANYAFCANATIMFAALMLFSREFRQVAAKVFRIKEVITFCTGKMAHGNIVIPIGPNKH